MVFRSCSGSESTMPGTAPKMPADTTCLLCRAALNKTVPGNIAVFEQQLSFTQRPAIDMLVDVLNTKESALTRSRWMCAHCYAQLELLDKYERDRRQLEQKASAIQSELVSAFRRAAADLQPPERKRLRRRGRQEEDDEEEEEDSVEPAANSAGDLKNGNESENDSDYVEINVASIAAAAAAAPFQDGSENGDAEAEDDPADERDPLAADMMDVKEEQLAVSDVSDVDLNEDVPAKDPLADGVDQEAVHETCHHNRRAVTPIVNVAALQNTLRTRLRSRLRASGGSTSPPAPPPLRVPSKRPLSPTTGDSAASPPPPPTAPPIQVSVCVVQPRSAALKTLLPKPGTGQPPPPASSAPTPPAPAPVPVPVPVPASVPSPTVSVSSSASSPAAAATAVVGTPQIPVLIQSTDGKLYMLPTGSQPAVTATSATAASPVTLLRLPDGRLVMSGATVAGVTQSPAPPVPPPLPPPILPPVTPPATSASTLKNLLLGGGGQVTGSGGGGGGGGQKQSTSGRSVSVRPDSQLMARRTRGPILESILQRPGSEPCPLCSLIFSTAAEVDHHLRNHSMVCSGCDHLFASRVALFEHRMTCVPARPPPLRTPPPASGPRSRAALCCTLCSATAPDTAELNEHAAQTHGLLYRCPKCDCRTAELLQYAHHVRSAHAMDVPHPCNLCQTSFLRSEQREMHVRERHGPPLQPLSDRPLVKDRTIDGVRLPSLTGDKRKATPPPPPSPPPRPAEEEEGKQEGAAGGAGDEEEHVTSGMLIVKEETDVLL